MARDDFDINRVPGSTGKANDAGISDKKAARLEAKAAKKAASDEAKAAKKADRKAKLDDSVSVVDLAEPRNQKKGFSFPGKPKNTAKKKLPPKRRKGASVASKVAYIVLIALAVVALAFFLLNQDFGGVSNPASYLGSVLAPVQDAFSSATKFVRDIVNGAKDYVAMTEENEKMSQEIVALKIQLMLTADDASEKERLQNLLDVKNTYSSLNPISARVIGKNPGVWFDTFTINRGTNDGVKVNMAVITKDGLAGRVFEVGLNYAKVMSLIDSRSSVSCLIERTRDVGVMRGQISSESTTAECKMYYLPVVNDIMPGDVVLSSGVDMLFPKGLTIGTVTSVSRQSDLSDQYIVIMPAVDFYHLEDVLVLRAEVETDSEGPMPVLFTPTPRPTPLTSPTPTPATTDDDLDDDDAIWRYPTSVVNPGSVDETPAPSTTPSVTFDPNAMPPEDAWSIGG